LGVELLHFALTLGTSSNHPQLEQCFIEGFGRMFDLPMYWCEFDSRQQKDKTLRSESVRLSLIICRAPTSPELTAARRAAHGLAAVGRARVLHVLDSGEDANPGEQLAGAGEAEHDHARHPTPSVAVEEEKLLVERVPRNHRRSLRKGPAGA
jgi:hypothetical protein